ncbi:hypothetical protein G4B88_029460 [Cannabis sativa]|uniref:Uncharacterized protein n=1 Tax=Cannabis sativa TaxID=3483 RepID=A0A7J6FFC8_CANSA|nr:hypothetical protein G4B88_029460 [Cannabis sativa]
MGTPPQCIQEPTMEFGCSDLNLWQEALSAYPSRIQSLNKPHLGFQSLPNVSKALSELTVLKGVGPATASAILAAYAPDVAPFMSDEAMEAALGNSKDYSAKQYLLFANKLQTKAKELSSGEESFTPSDVERALWSSVVAEKMLSSQSKSNESKTLRQKRKR